MKVVGVKFSDNSRVYGFKCVDDSVAEGDVVVCDTSEGLALGKISDANYSETVRATKYVVCKIDLNEHKKRIEKDKQEKALFEKMKARADAIDNLSLYARLAENDPDMKALLDAYKALN